MSTSANTMKKSEWRELIPLVAIFILKIVLMGLFSSDYQQKMFEPFVNEWLDGLSRGELNPYQAFYDRGESFDFPYPCGMLIIMSIGAFVNRLFPSAPMFIHNVIFKFPLLVFDTIGYIVLKKLYPGKRRNCFYIYLLSPIVLYSVFMHGQLDIIPMVLLLVSLYNISGSYSSRRFALSVTFLAASVTTKLHIIAVVPLIIIYIFKRFGSFKALIYTVTLCVADGLALSLIGGNGFMEGVVFNREVNSALLVVFEFGTLNLYLSLFAIGFIYLYILNLKLINREVLFTLCGMIFAVFLALCFPMPAWYTWVVPFMAVFLINVNSRTDSFWMHFFLNGAYLLYFVFFHKRAGVCDLYFCGISCDFLKVDSPTLVNICFTVLTCILVWNIYIMHKLGIANMGIYRFHDKNFVIGISGDSGAGKSTMQQKLSSLFMRNYLLVIEGDGDHKWERGDENWNEYTHLDPKANFLYRQAQDILKLKKSECVRRVDYDHSTGRFTEEKIIVPKKFISISGLHTLYLPQLRESLDLKIFLEADEELRCYWKVSRDSGERAQTEEDIRRKICERYEDAKKYIIPQKEYADIVFRHTLESKDPLRIGMQIWVNTQIDIGDIIEALHNLGVDIEYSFSENLRYQVVEYHPSENGGDPEIDFKKLFYNIVESNYEILGVDLKADDIGDGIEKLIIMRALSEKMRFSI